MTKKTTFVYDIPVEKFKEILAQSSASNTHYNYQQFQKNFKSASLTWCMLFNENRECVAAANVQVGYGPATNSAYVNEIQSLVAGHGYGKKMLMMLKKRYTFIWLCADPSVDGDALLKFYRDPEFNFSEYVIPANESIYKKDTHIFGINGRMPYQLWMSFLKSQYTEQHNLAECTTVYEPPYTLEQIKAKYPKSTYLKLANDPVHRWRAETGIELIHKEPTEEELDRIWQNWKLMPQEMKDISNSKSIELFGCTNDIHYYKLKSNAK